MIRSRLYLTVVLYSSSSHIYHHRVMDPHRPRFHSDVRSQGGRAGGYFHVNWNGDVAPCVFCPYAPKNINEVFENGGTLNEFWRKRYMEGPGETQNVIFPEPRSPGPLIPEPGSGRGQGERGSASQALRACRFNH